MSWANQMKRLTSNALIAKELKSDLVAEPPFCWNRTTKSVKKTDNMTFNAYLI